MRRMMRKPRDHRQPVHVVDGSRTPFLKVRGGPGPFHASDLAVHAGRALLTRLGVAPAQLDEVVLGCVSSGPDEANIGRVAALRLGCGERVPAWTVQRNCASGMQAVESAAQSIAHGRANLVLAGGTEAMSHHPVLLNELMVTWLAAWSRAHTLAARGKALAQLSPAHLKPVIALLRGLTDPVVGMSMGQTAEQLAYEFGIDRERMDSFAVRSHHRVVDAMEHDRLDEIEPIIGRDGQVFTGDDGVRPDSSVEKLAELKPVFDRPVGRVTAGNSAQVTDGAAMLLLASEQAIEEYDLPVLGRVVDTEWAGLAPERMGLGPVYAMAPLLERQGFNASDIDYWEINEAFAAQVLACLELAREPHVGAGSARDSGLNRGQSPLLHKRNEDPGHFGDIPEDRLNVDGGAIAIGHPVGASGARVVLHLLKTLERENATRGVASLCVGGGQGSAMLVERDR